ncbi:MAG: hypothetical protein U9O96_07980 [Candidatus Thermoplasmatota archaeon]|nr:hypothetical protein [Candidatus Thermoplasmatota archaeon]
MSGAINAGDTICVYVNSDTYTSKDETDSHNYPYSKRLGNIQCSDYICVI